MANSVGKLFRGGGTWKFVLRVFRKVKLFSEVILFMRDHPEETEVKIKMPVCKCLSKSGEE